MSIIINPHSQTGFPQEASPASAKATVLVTGGTGLVGGHLLSKLATNGQKVIAIHRGAIPANLQYEHVQWVPCDILDVVTLHQVMQGIEQVYHCAAIVSFNPAQQQQMFKINVEGTANVVNASLAAGVKKMVYISSVAALGRIRNGVAIDETMNWSEETSNSIYGKSKYLAELEVWRGIGEGLQALIVNPSIILGAADWNKGSAGIFKSAYNEFPWYTTGAGGFVDVEDVVKAMVQLMQSNVNAQRFIVNGENTTYLNIFSMAAKAFKKKPPHKKISPLMAAIVWRLEAIKAKFTSSNPLLTKETAKTALTSVSFDNTKLLQVLPGFVYTPIETTIQRVCNELKQSGVTATIAAKNV